MTLKGIAYRMSRLLQLIVADRVKVDIRECIQSDILSDKVVLVTGATGGLGLTFCSVFLKGGAKIILAARNADKLKDCKEKLGIVSSDYKDKVKTLVLDQLDTDSFENKLSEATLLYGKVDVLVNNAGIIASGIPDTDVDSWDKVVDTNLRSVYFLSQLFIKYLRDKKLKGNILNISSSSSLRPAISPYSISKWGIRGLTLGLAKLGVKYGITVNGLAPGPTSTPMLNKSCLDDMSLPYSPIGRFIHPAEVANMALFLISDMGRSIVGDTIYMTGGAGMLTFDDDEIRF